MFRNVLIVLVAFLYCNTVNASRTIIVQPSQIQRTYTPGSAGYAFNDSGNWTATVSTQSGAKVKVPVTATKKFGFAKWASGAKQLIKMNPAQAVASAGLAGVLAGVEWVMTEGTLTKPGSVSTCYHAYYGGAGMSTQCLYQSAGDACKALFSASGINYKSAGALSGGGCYYHHATQTPSYNQLGYWGSAQQSSGPVAVNDADIDGLIDPINDPGIAADSAPFIADNVPGSFDYPDDYTFDGPDSIDGPATTSTTTDPVTGDVTSTVSQPTYNFDFSTNPLTVTTTTTTTTNTYTNGQPTSSSTTTTAPDPVNVDTGGGGAPAPEVPTDCDFMPTVCNFIEWVKTPFDPEEVDFSQFAEDKDFKESITITGNATCPAPMILGTSKGDFEFSWQPACQWAGMLKPILIIGALIAAIYISLGIGRSD